MATRFYISTEEAAYFNNNVLSCSTSIPIKGYHNVGDLVISSIQKDNVIGWVCSVKGEPGEWIPIKNAGGLIDVKIEEINDTISELEIILNGQSSSILIVEDKLKNIENDISDITTQINKINYNLNTQTENITNINNEISDINIEINELRTDVDGNVERLDEVVGLIGGNLENNNNNLSSLKLSVTNNTNDINILNNKVGIIEKDLGNISGQVTTNINVMNNAISANTTGITNLNNSIKSMEDNITTVLESNAQIEQNYNELDTTIKDTVQEISDTKQDISNLSNETNDSISSIKQGIVDVLLENNVEVSIDNSWLELFGQMTSLFDKNVIKCTDISLDKEEITFTALNDIQLLVPSVTPIDTTENIVWESDNNIVAIVYNGVVISIGEGSCNLTVKCGDIETSCNVNVTVSSNN